MTFYPNSRALVRLNAPATEPVTLAAAKLYLRVDGNEEDGLITQLITVAREQAEKHLRKSLITQSWKLILDDYAPAHLQLPMGPVQNVTSIAAIDRDGNSSIVPADNYYLSAGNRSLIFDMVLYSHRIEITYVTGYGDAEDVPTPIIYGMLAVIACMYDQRGESALPIPSDAIALFAPYREVSL